MLKLYSIYRIIFYPVNLLFIGFVYIYKFLISPAIKPNCQYVPTCSSYAVETLKKWGIIESFIIIASRIIRCRPSIKGKIDLIPINIKGDYKWLC